jgi:hypothetical protein
MQLIITNIIYVLYRLLVTANVIKFLNKYMHYYVAVILAAQLSYAYDMAVFYWYFDNPVTSVWNIIQGDILYTLRVIAAWFVIKQLWNWLKNYYFAVFLGAEITFIVDYFIFGTITLG